MKARARPTRLATLGLILLPVIASLAACERKTQAKAVDARPVRTITAQKSDAGETIVLTGQISAENEVSLAFRIGGRDRGPALAALLGLREKHRRCAWRDGWSGPIKAMFT